MLELTVISSHSLGETVTATHLEAFFWVFLLDFIPSSMRFHLAVSHETSAEATAGCRVTQAVPPPLRVRATGIPLPPPQRPRVIYELSAWSASPPEDEESPSCWFFWGVIFFLLETWRKTNSR